MEVQQTHVDQATGGMQSLQCVIFEKTRSNSEFSDDSVSTEVEAKQSIRFGTTTQATWGILLDYSRISTIHGVRYMVARKRSWLERLMWICIFIAAICTCSYLISKIWLKWETTPVIITFNEKTTLISQIPFPSVVVCSDGATSGIFNFTEAFYQVIDNPSDNKFDNLSTTELMWICIFIAAICTCSYLISKIWRKWETTPVIVSFSEKTTPIWQIPFPSVVLCPESHITNNTFNFTEAFYQVIDNPSDNKFDNLSTTDYEYLQTLSQICDVDLAERLKFSKDEPIDVIDTLISLAPSINKSMPFAVWNRNIIFPDGYFTTVLTDLGVCYQFNGMHESETLRHPGQWNITIEGEVQKTSTWSLDKGYTHRTNDNTTYPERVQVSGARGGLFLVTQGFDYDLDFLCRGSVQGFSIQLLSPDEFPAANKQYIRIPFNKDIMLIIKPNLITTSESLRSYPSKRRQCFFNEERYLRFFKAYTQNNCYFECLTNYTFAKCGCVKFSMPRTQDMPVCQASDIKCYYDTEDNFLQEQFEFGLTGLSKSMPDCDCLPACTSLTYEVEISEAKFDVFKVLQAYKETYNDENPGLTMGRTSMFFKEAQFLTLKRTNLYDTTDFLAASGGLLGLFVGISVLSIVELLYFCSVRLISNLRMRRKIQICQGNVEVDDDESSKM